MVLIKSKPEAYLHEGLFPQTFNSLLNTFFDDSRVKASHFNFMPQADIIEREKEFEIRMSLPGIVKEDVKISLDGELLTVEGERKSSNTEEGGKFVKREISYGKFSRSFKVGKVNATMIEASFDQGFLSVRLPRLVEETKTISIK